MLVFPALLVPNSTVSGASLMSPESCHALKFLNLSLVSIRTPHSSSSNGIQRLISGAPSSCCDFPSFSRTLGSNLQLGAASVPDESSPSTVRGLRT